MRCYVRKLSIFVGLCMLAAPSISYAYSVADAVRAARNNNFSIKASREDFKIAKAGKYSALAQFMPQVNASSQMSHVDYSTPGANVYLGNPNTRVTNVTVQQSLFNGGSSILALKQAQEAINAAESNLIDMKDKTILNAITAYEDLITARDIYEISLNSEEILRKRLEEMQARLSLGEATITDVSQMEASLAQAVSQKINAKGNVTTSEAVFTQVTGDMPPIKMDGIKHQKITIPISIEELAEKTLRRNALIMAAESNVLAAKSTAKAAYSALLPQVVLSAQRTRSDLPKMINNNTDSDTYALTVKVPIFQGGSEYAGIKSAKHQHRKVKALRDTQISQIQQQVVQTWSMYHTTRSVIAASEKAIEAAYSALKGTEEEAKVGTKTTLDVLNAENTLFQARVDHRKAYRDHIISLFNMHYLMSNLSKMDFSQY